MEWVGQSVKMIFALPGLGVAGGSRVVGCRVLSRLKLEQYK